MNKYLSKTGALSVLILGLSTTLTISQPSLAESTDIRIFCGIRNGIPTTLARTPERDVPLIQWIYPFGGKTPKERCQIVSPKFQHYIIEKGMDYLTIKNTNGTPVICAASSPNSDCQDLFTIKSWNDADRVLQQMRNTPFTEGPIRQGGEEQIYFNLGAYLNKLSEESTDSQTISPFPLGSAGL